VSDTISKLVVLSHSCSHRSHISVILTNHKRFIISLLSPSKIGKMQQLLHQQRRMATNAKGVYQVDDTERTTLHSLTGSSVELNSSLLPCRRGGILKHSSQAASFESSYTASKKTSTVVQFSTITIKSYLIVLGDNPSAMRGAPISLGWKAVHSENLSLEDFEDHKPPRRSKHQMIIPRAIREDWLRDLGYTRAELKEAVDQATKIQKSRTKNAVQRTGLLGALRGLGRRSNSLMAVSA
jgi:hypothetical protein